jgi:hypothetical protein
MASTRTIELLKLHSGYRVVLVLCGPPLLQNSNARMRTISRPLIGNSYFADTSVGGGGAGVGGGGGGALRWKTLNRPSIPIAAKDAPRTR